MPIKLEHIERNSSSPRHTFINYNHAQYNFTNVSDHFKFRMARANRHQLDASLDTLAKHREKLLHRRHVCPSLCLRVGME